MELVKSIKEFFVVSTNREFLVNHQNITTLDLHAAQCHNTYEEAKAWLIDHHKKGFGGFYQIEKIFYLQLVK